MPDDFTDLDDAQRRIFRALRDRFDAAGFVVFDETFEPKPSRQRPGQDPRWGGYLIEFKIISRGEYQKLRKDVEALRRGALVVSPGNKRRFKVDISKFEFCSEKEEHELDSFTVYAYSLEMMAIEKAGEPLPADGRISAAIQPATTSEGLLRYLYNRDNRER
jgi:hypothetical protein